MGETRIYGTQPGPKNHKKNIYREREEAGIMELEGTITYHPVVLLNFHPF